jgi:predicted enzyme related to lactoylglutathione lyase
MKRIGFLSFGHWSRSPGSQTPTARDALVQTIELAEAADAGSPEETGGYAMFTYNGKLVAGVGPVMGGPPMSYWTTYFATDDVDALTERVEGASGTVIVPPMDVMDAGRMAMYSHPDAGMFGAWQAGNHKGAQLVNEPVSLAWNALMTRNVDSASTFLRAAFGLSTSPQEFGGGPYPIRMLGEQGVGGINDMPPGVPEEAPAFWNVSFSVQDTDATVAKATELGGQVMMPAMDMQGVGRIAGITDPYGATFSVASLLPS